MAITQIKEESTGFVSAANKFGAKQLEMKSVEVT
jgi:hypothetical protein